MWDILLRAYRGFVEDDGSVLAGHIAFSTLLGFLPFLLIATNVGALFVGEEEAQSLVDQLFLYAPSHLAETLEPVLRSVLKGAGGGLLTLSAISGLWFSSNAVEALRLAFDRAYNVHRPRSFVAARLVAFGVVILGTAVALILALTIVFAPQVIAALQSWAGVTVPGVAQGLRFLIGISVFTGFLLLLHRVLPRHRLSFSRLWPGAVFSAVVWVLAATGFSAYIGVTPTYVSIYGALAGVVVTLIFFYISGLTIIFGAELNAAIAGRIH